MSVLIKFQFGALLCSKTWKEIGTFVDLFILIGQQQLFSVSMRAPQIFFVSVSLFLSLSVSLFVCLSQGGRGGGGGGGGGGDFVHQDSRKKNCDAGSDRLMRFCVNCGALMQTFCNVKHHWMPQSGNRHFYVSCLLEILTRKATIDLWFGAELGGKLSQWRSKYGFYVCVRRQQQPYGVA